MMKFIQGINSETITVEVNEALANGYEYLETHYDATGAYPWTLVILRKE